MEVRDVPRGEAASADSGRITINTLPNGKFGFTGHVRSRNAMAHTVSQDAFDSEDAALAHAVDWAEDNDVRVLYVERPT
jgi:hypothetical protein